MLDSIIKIFTDKSELIWFLLRIPVVLLALSFHEMSHAYAAYKMGDETAKNLGRLTMNPLKHLDLVGSICLLFFGIGWAKPVPIMTRNFENPKKGMVLTSLAGPASNVFLSAVAFILCVIFSVMFGYTDYLKVASEGFGSIFAFILCLFLYIFHTANLAYAIFNMLPVPPLDGSRLALAFLPDKFYFGIMRYERYIMIGFLVLMYFVGFSWLSKLIYLISDGLFSLVSLIPGLEGVKMIPDVLFYFLGNI